MKKAMPLIIAAVTIICFLIIISLQTNSIANLEETVSIQAEIIALKDDSIKSQQTTIEVLQSEIEFLKQTVSWYHLKLTGEKHQFELEAEK